MQEEINVNLSGQELPVIQKVSFGKLIDMLHVRAREMNDGSEELLNIFLSEIDSMPELRSGIDETQIEKYRKVVDKLFGFIFPHALTHNEIKCANPAFLMNPMFMSARFSEILEEAGPDYSWDVANYNFDDQYILICMAILATQFNMPVHVKRPYVIRIPNQTTGKDRYYRMTINTDFMDIKRTERSLDISDADFQHLMDNFSDVTVWKEKFPVDSWILTGFSLFSFIDVTADVQLAKVTDDLLEGGKHGMMKFRNNLRQLFDIPDLKVSLVSINGDALVQGTLKGVDRLLLGKEDSVLIKDLLCESSTDCLIERNEAFVLSDVKEYHRTAQSLMSSNLVKKRIKSYIIVPIVYEGRILGFLELGASEISRLNKSSLIKLDHVMPTIVTAANRYNEEFMNRVEAVIQTECTTIHPTVFWKFQEEAVKFITAEETGKKHVFKDLVFSEVYPLYGQLDIKGSSSKRNEAVKKDLNTQLSAAVKILKMAARQDKLPIYDELVFRLEQCVQEVSEEMRAGSESSIMRFLASEVDLVFKHLSSSEGKLGEHIAAYHDSLSETFNMRYEERRKFDESVLQINKALAENLDKAQQEAQAMFPHYFERYKTDGVEFNMYIGQSLTNSAQFNALYLKNLRLWQLMVMSDMENEFHQLRKTLAVELEVASLILVYSVPMAIHFRMDEKRFDVEGSYNARYEVIKKRIDKSFIKGTEERLTVPGKIAIVYTRDEDEEEYSKYIDFLGVKGYLASEKKEFVMVEDLQGVTGLRAIRVPVLYKDTGLQSSLSIEEIIQQIEVEGGE